jgi:hypothetical protein
MYGALYEKFFSSAKENFEGGSSSSGGAFLMALIMVAVFLAIHLFIVQWLWNTVLTKVVSIARPLPSLWYTLGLLLLIAMVHPGCAMMY